MSMNILHINNQNNTLITDKQLHAIERLKELIIDYFFSIFQLL